MPYESLDVTPVIDPSRFRRAAGLGTPVSGRRRTTVDHTRFTFQISKASEAKAVRTETATEIADDVGEDLATPTSSDEGDELTKTRDARLALLARKFQGDASAEDAARIHLLTVRLRRLDPRVTEHERRTADEVVASMEGIAQRVDALREKLGL